jgi:DNA-binding transcriptional MerR regulator
MDGLTIGQLARRAGLSREAIRYYERRGLLAEPARTAAGHRRYGESALLELRAVRAAQTVGFRLGEIRQLLEAVRQGPAPCPPVMDLTRRRLAEVERRIAALEAARQCLAGILEACGGQRCEVSLEHLGRLYDGAPDGRLIEAPRRRRRRGPRVGAGR